MSKSQKVQKCDFGSGHIMLMKLLNYEMNIKTREISVDLPRNDNSLSLRSLEFGQLEVLKSHFLCFMTRYVPNCQKVKEY